MTQRLDDMTGDPIRLTAQQRELQRQGMIAMLNAQTRQINTLTEAMRGLRDELSAQRALIATLRTELDGHVAWHWTENRASGWRQVMRQLFGRWR